MKKHLCTIALVFAVHFLSAQNPVPNSSFENWISGKPAGWTRSTHISIDSPGHTGSYVVRGDNHGYLVTDQSGTDPGFGISQCYCSFTFYYKLTAVSGDYLSVDATIYDSIAGHGLWDGYASITPNTSTFQQYTMPVHCGPGAPSSFYADFGIANNSSSGLTDPGSSFVIDDVVLVPCSAAGVSQTKNNPLQFFISPNPAHTYIDIQANSAVRDASIEIYNAIGERLSVTPWNGSAIQIDMSMLPIGLYLFALRQDGSTTIKKVQKD